jgi:flagellar hook-associated protein 1 FlgK
MGAAINDMLNSFSDVASTPTDLTARTVALTRVDETARRMRAASQSLDDLQLGIGQALTEKISAVNTLAQKVAAVNSQIALAQGGGQPPNDLLDKRDQLIRDINQYVQTTSVMADDGSVGLYIGGSQALVLGSSASTLSAGKNDFGDPGQAKLVISREGQSVTMDENSLGGGAISGLLRFQNNDLMEGRNLLGRLTATVTTSMNAQHALGLDLDGKAGGNLFTPVSVNNILTPIAPATPNAGSATLQLGVLDPAKLVVTNYAVTIDAAGGATVTRVSDNAVVAGPAGFPLDFDGLRLSNLGGSANSGDRFLLKPFSTAATSVAREFSSPRALAVASPFVGQMGANNTGSLQLTSLMAKTNPAAAGPATVADAPIAFISSSQYTFGGATYTYTSGQSIPPPTIASSWSVTLQGVPQAGDSFTVKDIRTTSLDPKLNGGNANNLMNLRDAAVFDGASMTDGYASLISQIGIRAQSANYSATVSTNIATNAEKDRTGIAGVNLDEEAAKLIQYQQAYQASAKMIQIAQSIFDTLIQTLAR